MFNNRKLFFKRLRWFLCLVYLKSFFSILSVIYLLHFIQKYTVSFNLQAWSFSLSKYAIFAWQNLREMITLCIHWKWSLVLLFIWSFDFHLVEQTCMTFWNFVHFKNSAPPKLHLFNCMTIALTGSPHPQASI